MMRSPILPGSIISGGAPNRCLAMTSYKGVNATNTWRAVRTALTPIMKRRIRAYEAQSLLSAVEAARSMIIVDSMINARGNTIPP